MQRPGGDEGVATENLRRGRAWEGTASAKATRQERACQALEQQQGDQCGWGGVSWKRKNAVQKKDQRSGDQDKIMEGPADPRQEAGFYPEQDGEPCRALSRGGV